MIKEYPFYDYAIHTIKITLMCDDFKREIITTTGGNCRGASLLDVDQDTIMNAFDLEDEVYEISLYNEHGEELIVDIDEVEELVVGVEIIKVEEQKRE